MSNETIFSRFSRFSRNFQNFQNVQDFQKFQDLHFSQLSQDFQNLESLENPDTFENLENFEKSWKSWKSWKFWQSWKSWKSWQSSKSWKFWKSWNILENLGYIEKNVSLDMYEGGIPPLSFKSGILMSPSAFIWYHPKMILDMSYWVHPKYTKPSVEYKLRSQDHESNWFHVLFMFSVHGNHFTMIKSRSTASARISAYADYCRTGNFCDRLFSRISATGWISG